MKDGSETFDKQYISELITFGGFHPQVAAKVSEKEGLTTIEQRTEYVGQLSKQVKDGSIDILENGFDGPLSSLAMESTKLAAEAASENLFKQSRNPEESSETLAYLKQSF